MKPCKIENWQWCPRPRKLARFAIKFLSDLFWNFTIFPKQKFNIYQLAVKNKLFIFDELQVLFTEFVDWALEKNLDLEDDVDEEAPAAEPEEAAPAEAAAEPEATEAAEAPEASTEASEAPAEEAPKEEKPAEAAEWMPG